MHENQEITDVTDGDRDEQRKVVVSEFLTLDGVMQAPGGAEEDRSGGFEHGGWQAPYFDDVAGRAIDESMSTSDAFLMGRKTYEIMVSYWPNSDEDIAELMNERPKYVASTTLTDVEWENSTLIEGDVPEAVAELKRGEGGNLLVFGSGELVRTLMAHDLVDEYQLMIHPVVLGSGKRLFREGSSRTDLRLVNAETTSMGVVIATYEPVAEDASASASDGR